MEKEFMVFYEHTGYGYYTTTIYAENIVEALTYFIESHAYGEIYGIMEKK
jgi:hypothetical protein